VCLQHPLKTLDNCFQVSFSQLPSGFPLLTGRAGASPGPPGVLRRRLDKSCGFFGTHHLSLLSMHPAMAAGLSDEWPIAMLQYSTVIHTVLCGLLLQYLHVYRVPTNPITKQHPSRVKFGLRHPLRVMSHSDTTPVWHPSLHACSDAALVRSRRGGCDGATACPSLLQRLGQCVHSSLCFRNRESSEKMQRRSISALLERRNAQRSGAPGA